MSIEARRGASYAPGSPLILTGPRSCGKSELAERIFLKLGTELSYVATLESCTMTEPAIQRHRARRDERWTVFEASGEPETDLAMLGSVGRSGRPVLLDGSAYLLARLAYDANGLATAALARTFNAMRDLFAGLNQPWIVVDPDPASLRKAGGAQLAALVAYYHAILTLEYGARVLSIG